MAVTPFKSPIIADLGISMGDEGKGRLVYELIEEWKSQTQPGTDVSMVLKVNGGANSGHTAAGMKLNLLPAGIVDENIPHLGLGAGVVADPRKLLWESKPLEAKGHTILKRLRIDERTQVCDLSHRLLDLAWEYYREHILNEPSRGSTGRGISPAYADETSQWQIFYQDFCGAKDVFAEKAGFRLERALDIIKHVCHVPESEWDPFFEMLTTAELRANQASIDAGIFAEEEFRFERFKGDKPFTLNMEEVIDTYWKAGREVCEAITDIREIVLEALDNQQAVIGEFGQSYWLDKRKGFPPNVTASHTFTPELFESAGIPPQTIHNMGCCKAYDTKVGTHIFLTEMEEEHPLAKKLKKLEFGTSTGRQRKVGWFDAVEKGDALRYGGFDDLVINKLDALSYSDSWDSGEILVCTAYEDEHANVHRRVPRCDLTRSQLKPVYRSLPGWREDISAMRRFEELPEAAKRYVGVLYKHIVDIANRNRSTYSQLPQLRYIGIGPDPGQIIKDAPDPEALLEIGK